MKQYSSNKHLLYKNNCINTSQLIHHYFSSIPDPKINEQKVKFGTSGHRGCSIDCTFNERHVLAITQSIVQFRRKHKVGGPCYVGKDTHALSELAFISVIEVLSANNVDIIIETIDGYTPTPIITHAILNYNKTFYNENLRADGIVVTSSHNPPEDGGIKYYLCHGGAADTNVTENIEKHSNMLLLNNLRGIRRFTLRQARQSGYIHILDFTQNYVTELTRVVNIQSIKRSGLKLRIDLMGGSGINCWQRIAQFHKLNLVFTNEKIDPTFQCTFSDYDETSKINSTSKNVIDDMLKIRNQFDLILANDPDCDRYNVITSSGCVKSNDYLIIAISYLFQNRPNWNRKLGVGKTLVSSILIDRIVKKFKLALLEAPIGFKWFVKCLLYSILGFVGEESSGGIFLNFDASPWSTDKDGIIMCLLAAEISSITGKNLQEFYNELIQNIDLSSYHCTQVPIDYYSNHKIFFNFFISKQMTLKELAGYPITKKIKIIGNRTGTKVNGIKLITDHGWSAFRCSGTEKIYKIYSESYLGDSHRKKIEKEIYEHLSNVSKKIL